MTSGPFRRKPNLLILITDQDRLPTVDPERSQIRLHVGDDGLRPEIVDLDV